MFNNPAMFTNWKKSSYSGDGPTCVEFATAAGAEGIRDSTDPGTFLTFRPGAHKRFIHAVRTNSFVTVND